MINDTEPIKNIELEELPIESTKTSKVKLVWLAVAFLGCILAAILSIIGLSSRISLPTLFRSPLQLNDYDTTPLNPLNNHVVIDPDIFSRVLALLEHDLGADSPLFISIFGQVFDVTEDKEYFSTLPPLYHFPELDMTSIFALGGPQSSTFPEQSPLDQSPVQISQLGPFHIQSAETWLMSISLRYTFVGVLVGPYFTEAGAPTALLTRIKLLSRYISLGTAESLPWDRPISSSLPRCENSWFEHTGSVAWCRQEKHYEQAKLLSRQSREKDIEKRKKGYDMSDLMYGTDVEKKDKDTDINDDDYYNSYDKPHPPQSPISKTHKRRRNGDLRSAQHHESVEQHKKRQQEKLDDSNQKPRETTSQGPRGVDMAEDAITETNNGSNSNRASQWLQWLSPHSESDVDDSTKYDYSNSPGAIKDPVTWSNIHLPKMTSKELHPTVHDRPYTPVRYPRRLHSGLLNFNDISSRITLSMGLLSNNPKFTTDNNVINHSDILSLITDEILSELEWTEQCVCATTTQIVALSTYIEPESLSYSYISSIYHHIYGRSVYDIDNNSQTNRNTPLSPSINDDITKTQEYELPKHHDNLQEIRHTSTLHRAMSILSLDDLSNTPRNHQQQNTTMSITKNPHPQVLVGASLSNQDDIISSQESLSGETSIGIAKYQFLYSDRDSAGTSMVSSSYMLRNTNPILQQPVPQQHVPQKMQHQEASIRAKQTLKATSWLLENRPKVSPALDNNIHSLLSSLSPHYTLKDTAPDNNSSKNKPQRTNHHKIFNIHTYDKQNGNIDYSNIDEDNDILQTPQIIKIHDTLGHHPECSNDQTLTVTRALIQTHKPIVEALNDDDNNKVLHNMHWDDYHIDGNAYMQHGITIDPATYHITQNDGKNRDVHTINEQRYKAFEFNGMDLNLNRYGPAGSSRSGKRNGVVQPPSRTRVQDSTKTDEYLTLPVPSFLRLMQIETLEGCDPQSISCAL